jgi:hypothetical protein
MYVSSVSCQKDPTVTIAINQTDVGLPERVPDQMVKTDTGSAHPFIEEALEGLNRGRQGLVFMLVSMLPFCYA